MIGFPRTYVSSRERLKFKSKIMNHDLFFSFPWASYAFVHIPTWFSSSEKCDLFDRREIKIMIYIGGNV